MKKELIGRKSEAETLKNLLKSREAEMLAVIGRRRVGKTFLVRTVYKDLIKFEITGIQNATQKIQLQNFTAELLNVSKKAKSFAIPLNWLEAFQQLSNLLDNSVSRKKAVLFFDELPWLASRKSGFLEALGHFWNTWASKRNVIVVICGSAASWMINKVVHNKGGLHNRITKLINLQPFTLAETKNFLKSRKIHLDNYQIVQLYMAIGGIPHYLKEVQPGLSAAQNIDLICFRKNSLLRDEFQKLYPALFENAEKHLGIIRALASKWKGLTRNEIVSISKIADGGSLSQAISELISSGFISAYLPFGKKKKETLYRLTDEYSIFYIKFIEKQQKQGVNTWMRLSQTQSWKSWSGFAFENICLKHITSIKNALGIRGVYSEESSYYSKGADTVNGFQVDLIIDRKDNIINFCEIKFISGEFVINKSYATEMRNKINLFKMQTRTRKSVFLTFISPYGVKNNIHSTGLVEHNITIDTFFDEKFT